MIMLCGFFLAELEGWPDVEYFARREHFGCGFSKFSNSSCCGSDTENSTAVAVASVTCSAGVALGQAAGLKCG